MAYLSSAPGPDWTGEPLADGLLTFAVGLLAVIYFAAVILIGTDYHDADGFTDCYPNCSLLQYSVGAAFWYGGAALVLSGLFSFGVLVAVAAKGRRGEPSR